MKITHEYSDGNNLIRLQMENGMVFIHLDTLGKCFGKKSQDFLNLNSTQEFIAYLEKGNRTGLPILDIRKKCKNPGIWGQCSLAFEYAHWLNPAFGICFRKCLKDFIKTPITHASREQWPIDTISDDELSDLIYEAYEYRNGIMDYDPLLIKALDNAAFENQYKRSFETHLSKIADEDIAYLTGIKVSMFKEILKREGIIYDCGGTWLFTEKYQNRNFSITEYNVWFDDKNKLNCNIRTSWTSEGADFATEWFYKGEKANSTSKRIKRSYLQTA